MTSDRACDACGGDAWRPRWDAFLVCGRCGLMTVASPPDRAQAEQLYQAAYFEGAEYIDYVADKPAHQRTLQGHLRAVRRYVRIGQPLLEVGCAYGFFLELIRELYPGSMGVDVSAAAAAQARHRGLDARDGDLLDLEIERSFDGVCLWDTIEHLSAPLATIQKCGTLLNPGGHLFLSTGDFGSLLARLRGRRWRQIHPPTHLFYFTRESLRQLCLRAGLQAVEFRTVTVHRRLGSVLEALARFHGGSLSGRIAGLLRRALPKPGLDLCLPLNLGDTLLLIARRVR